MKIRKGTGVLSKDGRTPFAPERLSYRTGSMLCFADYSMNNMALLIEALHKGQIDAVELIDKNNHKFVYELRVAEKKLLTRNGAYERSSNTPNSCKAER